MYLSFRLLFFLILLAIFSYSPNICAQEVVSSDLEQLDFANGLFERELYVMAINEYQKFLSEFPESPHRLDARLGIAESYFFLEQYPPALKAYQHYAQLSLDAPRHAFIQLRLGQTHFFLGDYEQAVSSLESIRLGDLQEKFIPNLYFYSAKAYRSLGQSEMALQYLQKILGIKEENPYIVSAHLEIANFYTQQKKEQEALWHYQQAYQEATSEEMKALVWYRQGEALFLNQKYEQAIDQFRKIIQNYPKQNIAQQALGNMLLGFFNLNRYDQLVEEYQQYQDFIEQKAFFYDIHSIVVQGLIALKQWEDAEALLDKISSFPSLNQEQRRKFSLKKIELLQQTQRFKAALDFIQKGFEQGFIDQAHRLFLEAESYYGLEDFEKTLTLYQEILKHHGDSSFADLAQYGVAHTQQALGLKQEALELFVRYFREGQTPWKQEQALYQAMLLARSLKSSDQAIALAEGYLATFEHKKSSHEQIVFLLGNIYADNQQYPQAIDQFTNYIKEFPQSQRVQEAYFLLGYYLQLTNRMDEALTYYKEVSSDGGKSKIYHSALKNMALIYLKQNREKEALETFDQVIMQFADKDLDISTYLWVAEQYLKQKAFTDSLRILDKIPDKSLPRQQKRWMDYIKAESYRGEENYEEALDHYGRLLAENAAEEFSGSARLGRGLTLKALKRFQEAKGEFEKAVEENPNDHAVAMQARFELANIARLQEQWEEAGKLYMLVAVLYKDENYSPEALFRAGEIFEKLEQVPQAMKVYQELIEVYQQSPFLKKAQERMDVLNG